MTPTPIHSFLVEYKNADGVRLHMPGHKGSDELSAYDITEISGADSLFEADGIIKESEGIASDIFGADTFYSTEGSSLSIRAMLYLATLYAKQNGKGAKIAAARNVHKSFISAAALIDFEVDWIVGKESSYLSCRITKEDIKNYLDSTSELPTAVYITSPDYLGYISDIGGIADECKRRGVLLLVDNAHGAYLKFTAPSLHPIDLGADMCADSAHKTLPALTGCAYLHISKNAPSFFNDRVKGAMMLFASTSPSYLLLDSLDKLNPYLAGKYPRDLQTFISKIDNIKEKLAGSGYSIVDGEPLKITISARKYGYTGQQIADLLRKENIECEFADLDYIVLMPSPNNSDNDLERLTSVLSALKRKEAISSLPPRSHLPRRKMSVREAVMSPTEDLRCDDCLGRIASTITLGCPPAIPIAAPGEVIDDNVIDTFKYYGISTCSVVKF
ncbi:MAG: aminotransferase class V-fold PLP-dependent enzyme [Clostridia bacterium]|nr:aminotransferase class V-fold PLP-dependent enzyme [Clostridia bacterium]